MIIFDRKQFHAKFNAVIFIFLICLLAAFLELLNITIIKREFYLKKCSEIAWVTKTIPAIRGSIYDKNKVLLAWSERTFDLLFEPNISSIDREKIISAVKEEISIDDPINSNHLIIKQNLEPMEIRKLQKVLKKFYGKIYIQSKVKRVIVDYPEVKAFIGFPPEKDNKGSGIELLYDDKLRGNDAVFTVMLDRHRNWIPHSFKWIHQYKQGEDLILPFSIDEIIQQEKTKIQK